MILSDKLGKLNSAFRWHLEKTPKDEFIITVYPSAASAAGAPHSVQTKPHKNLHNAVDEAIDLFANHLSGCPIC